MRVDWVDGDAAPEGAFSVDLQTKVWVLKANQMVRVPIFRGKRGIEWSERWVPSMTGTVKYVWDVPLGNEQVRHMFAGLINLPGMPTSRPPEVQGGFDESTGSVTISLYGNVFTITGWLTGGDSEAAQVDQQSNTGSTVGSTGLAILPGGEIVDQGAK